MPHATSSSLFKKIKLLKADGTPITPETSVGPSLFEGTPLKPETKIESVELSLKALSLETKELK